MVTNTSAPMPAFYIPHGGGPCFFMDQSLFPPGLWDSMAQFLRDLPGHIPQTPKAIVVISAHWEESVATVTTAANPTLLYDYYGFPEETYRLTYPVAGAPDVALRLQQLLQVQGFETAFDDQRGLDHGVFIPFKLIYPDSQIPMLQLSLHVSLDPAYHLAMGQALASLREEGVLIVGSGMSFHNLRAMFAPSAQTAKEAMAFDGWLKDTVTGSDGTQRNDTLIRWASAPGARASHPREEHLLPLMVAAGASASGIATCIYSDMLGDKPISAFKFS